MHDFVAMAERVMLLDRRLAVWRDRDGTVHVLDDTCPHRGTRLSLDRFAIVYRRRLADIGFPVVRSAPVSAGLS